LKVFTKNSNNGSASNSFVQRKGNGAFFGVQTKLKVGKPNDKYEVEADSVAEKVVAKNEQQKHTAFSSPPFFSPAPATQIQRMPFEEVQKQEDETVQEKSIAESITPVVQLAPAEEETVQEKCDGCESKEEQIQKMPFEEVQKEEEEEAVQAKEDEDVQMMEDEEAQTKEDEDVQTKISIPKKPPKDITSQIQNERGKGSSLPSKTKLEMESGFGADFSGVKVHTSSESASMNKDLGAKAFTTKNDVFFNEGKFSPASKEGKTLLAHELTHTIQQGASSPISTDKQALANEKPSLNGVTSKGNKDKATSVSEVAAQEVVSEEKKENVEENKPVDGEKGKEGEKKDGKEKGAKEEDVKTTPRSPKEDPNFKKLEGRVETTAAGQQDHEPASASAGAAQGAAVSPANERASMAQAGQVDEMDNAEAGDFNAEDFKAQLMQRIESMQLPATQDEAMDFDDNNNIEEVSNAASQDVQNEQTAAAGPIEQTSQQEPNVDAIPEREVTPLPEAPIGTPPASVNPKKAMPPKRGDGEVNKPLQDNMAEVDTQMADNEITEEQLAKSNEPTFIAGLDAKGKAKEHTDTAPTGLRQQEQGILQNTQAGANTTGQVGLQGMHQDRTTSLNQVAGQQQQTGTTDTTERTRIAGEINTIYEKAKTDVEKILGDLDTNVNTLFTAGTVLAKQKFESYVERKMDAYKSRRYSGLSGAAQWLIDKFTGLPDEVNEFFAEGREVYIDYMDKVITVVANLVANKLNEAKERITTGKQEVQDYVTSLPENLQQIGTDAAEEISTKFDELQDSVNSKQDELIDSLAQQYTEGLEAVDARIEEMKAANRGLIDMALDAIVGIIQTIIDIKNMLTELLLGALSAIMSIIEDPIGFLSNLFSGLAQGFTNFGNNILKHLQTGLIQWLTGTLGPVGITIPDDLFSLKGIFSLIAQVLGLTWDYIRSKAVKLLGEPVVNALETGFEIFQILRTGGIDGLWEYLKDQFNDLKETVMGAIKEMVITTVVEAGIKWVLGLMNPASAFVKACMMIIDVVRFFIERGSQIIELVKAFTEGVKAVASGDVSKVASAIENALAKALPVIIGFLASLLGISGLARKVQKIIKKIRKRIDKAIDKLIKKAKKAFRKLVGRGDSRAQNANDNGPDNRTAAEKERDVKKATRDAENYYNANSKDPSKLRRKLPEIKTLYKLKKIDLKTVNEKLKVVAEINPRDEEDLDSPALPPTHISYNAFNVTADPLTSNRSRGSRPGALPGWGHAQALNSVHDSWVRGHMVSEDLGGRGVSGNLSIITKSNNGLMETGPESLAKTQTAAGEKLHYKTTWENHPKNGAIENFAKSITVTVSKYNGENKVRIGSPFIFTQGAPPVSATGVTFNLNDIGRPTIVQQFNVSSDFALDILEAKSYGRYTSDSDLTAKIERLYTSKNITQESRKWKSIRTNITKLRTKMSANSSLEII